MLIRPAPGYPSCGTRKKALIWDLFSRTMHRHETHRYMWPAASVCGCDPPTRSNYFTLGRIDEDQAQGYAKRKGWDERMMKWLGVAMK